MDEVHIYLTRATQSCLDILRRDGRVGHTFIGFDPQRVFEVPGNGFSLPVGVRCQEHLVSILNQAGELFQDVRLGWCIAQFKVRRLQAIALIRQVTHMAATGGNTPFSAKNILQFLNLARAFNNQKSHRVSSFSCSIFRPNPS